MLVIWKKMGRCALRVVMGGLFLVGGLGAFSAPAALYHLGQFGRTLTV